MPNNIYKQNGHKAEFTFLPSDDKFLDSLSEVSSIWLIEGLDTSLLIRYFDDNVVKEFKADRIAEFNLSQVTAEFFDDFIETGGAESDTVTIPVSMIERVILYIQ